MTNEFQNLFVNVFVDEDSGDIISNNDQIISHLQYLLNSFEQIPQDNSWEKITVSTLDEQTYPNLKN